VLSDSLESRRPAQGVAKLVQPTAVLSPGHHNMVVQPSTGVCNHGLAAGGNCELASGRQPAAHHMQHPTHVFLHKLLEKFFCRLYEGGFCFAHSHLNTM
jgi:hypothetical protein